MHERDGGLARHPLPPLGKQTVSRAVTVSSATARSYEGQAWAFWHHTLGTTRLLTKSRWTVRLRVIALHPCLLVPLVTVLTTQGRPLLKEVL